MNPDVRGEVLRVLTEKFGVAVDALSDASRLREDLDLDSIDLFDMLGAIEKRIGVSVDISDFAQAKTFGDFVITLEALLIQESATPE